MKVLQGWSAYIWGKRLCYAVWLVNELSLAFKWELTPYAESLAPITRNLQNVASVLIMFVRG